MYASITVWVLTQYQGGTIHGQKMLQFGPMSRSKKTYRIKLSSVRKETRDISWCLEYCMNVRQKRIGTVVFTHVHISI